MKGLLERERVIENEVVKDAVIEEVQLGEVSEVSETQNTEEVHEEDKAMIGNMKEEIHSTTKKVAQKVNHSAAKYMTEKGYINEEHVEAVKEFMTFKVPSVLATEVSKVLNETLGLDINPEDVS